MQGNCVVALAALAVTTTKYAHNLDAEALEKAAEATEHLGQAHWLSVVVNTVLAILDFSYQPTARVMQICQQVRCGYMFQKCVFFNIRVIWPWDDRREKLM